MLEIKRIKANGLQFAYHEIGTGPLVLYFHGFPDTPTSFFDAAQKLSEQGFRVVMPYLRGYTPTEKPADQDYSMPALANDVLALIDVLCMGDEKSVVIGHDWGALMAYTAANIDSSRFRCLIQMSAPHMASTSYSFKQLKMSWYVWYFQLPGRAEKKVPARNFAFIDKLYNKWSPQWNDNQASLQAIKECLKDAAGVKAAVSYYRAMITGLKKDTWKLMNTPTSVPTLLVAGEDDGCIHLSQYDKSADVYTGFYRFISYPNVGHFPQQENAQMLVEDILEFVNQCPA